MRWEIVISLLVAAALLFVLRDNIIVHALENLAWAIVTLIATIGRLFDPMTWLFPRVLPMP